MIRSRPVNPEAEHPEVYENNCRADDILKQAKQFSATAFDVEYNPSHPHSLRSNSDFR